MTLRRLVFTLSLGAAVATSGSVVAGESCFGHKQACEAICTPERIARYYADNPDRCSASCNPRFYHCGKTGFWTDLEDGRPGWREPAEPF